jgi:ribonucleoside-triphosphate reductase
VRFTELKGDIIVLETDTLTQIQITSMDERINNLLHHDESIIDENANKDSNVLSTMRDLLAGEVSKDFALRQILPKHIADAHISGDIHFHDLLFSPTLPYFNCMLIDFKGMFENGFTIGDAEIEPPRSIRTATALIAQIVANVSSNMYGGVSFNRADEVLEKYAKMSYDKYIKNAREWFDDEEKIKDFAYKMTKKEINDSMQSLEYEINTLFSSQGQVPFFSFNFGLGTSWFAREIQKATLKVRIDGIGKNHKTAVFPKLIFTLKRGVNLEKDDPNYDIKKLALECSAKRIYPDILSYDRIKELLGYFISPMG